MSPISRRRFLVAGGAAAGAAAVAATAGIALGRDDTPAGAAGIKGSEPFYGRHQSGIATEQQDRLLFASFDLVTERRDDLVGLLRAWTQAAARMAEGLPARPDRANPLAPPSDTGEVIGLDPARLTLTFGFGTSLFAGPDRFGVAARPPAMVDIPPFPGDDLDPARSGGDLCVQACGNDPQVLYHAVRNLTRIGRGVVTLRWIQQGFGRTSATSSPQSTPRNLMGFKDGTSNLRSGDPSFAEQVWAVPADGAPWMDGGSYLVTRRIRMHIEMWDRTSLREQEHTIGRDKVEGAPLGGTSELDPVNLTAADPDGTLVIPENAHIRLASQDANRIHFLRRSYSFTDGIDPRTGQLDAGLFFIAFQRDPRAQFIPMQDKLSRLDALNQFIQHVGSALFAVPPGVAGAGGFIGETLFSRERGERVP